MWKYNGALDKWIQIESMMTGRWRHKMAVHGGKVYALGGFDGVQRLASVESYDPFHNRWSQVHKQVFNHVARLWEDRPKWFQKVAAAILISFSLRA